MFRLLDVRYKNILSIDRLDIPRGKVTCIVGESGSGKSTLLKLLNNMISADSGEIYYDDDPLNSLNPLELRRKVIMLQQQPAIFGGNLKDNLAIGLVFSGKSVPGDEKLSQVLNMVKLNKSLTDNPEKFSGGEKQRLALARVLVMEPEVLLLDEPSSALDDNTEDAVIANIVEHVRENGITLVMVTHSKKVAGSFGENIVEIHNGKIV